jgi:hypothetical protein
VSKVDEPSRVTSDILWGEAILIWRTGILNTSCSASGFQGFSKFVGDPIKPYIQLAFSFSELGRKSEGSEDSCEAGSSDIEFALEVTPSCHAVKYRVFAPAAVTSLD